MGYNLHGMKKVLAKGTMLAQGGKVNGLMLIALLLVSLARNYTPKEWKRGGGGMGV